MPNLGESMLNAISHCHDAAFPQQLFVKGNPGGGNIFRRLRPCQVTGVLVT